MSLPLGEALPPHTPHAICTSMPAWDDYIKREEGDENVLNKTVAGYPRFFLHLSVVKLASIYEQKYALEGEQCMLFPSHRAADQCRSFMEQQQTKEGSPIDPRLLHLICPEDKRRQSNNTIIDSEPSGNEDSIARSSVDLHIVFFPSEAYSTASDFWQYTGMGISSRLAEKCLSLLPDDAPMVQIPTNPIVGNYFTKDNNRHYFAVKSPCKSPSSSTAPASEVSTTHPISPEERYGVNFTPTSPAKRALRSRIAGFIRDSCQWEPERTQQNDLVIDPGVRGIADVAAEDVYLFPAGMSAIWNVHELIKATRPPAKYISFGFLYTETLSVLRKWGSSYHFFGHATDSDIDELEKILEAEAKSDPTKSPATALFTEFPSNPLLRSPNLPRLKALADKYDFLIVIDDTIGNFVNVDVLPYIDILVTSLSKIFSGACDVLGGSLVLNPGGRHYSTLKAHLESSFEDIYFEEDAICMERNSRDFRERVRLNDINAEAACEFLRSRSQALGIVPSPAIKEVFYPKYITLENYERCRTKAAGYGCLFSLSFTSVAASKAFFDALPFYKGPTFGTNFTLAVPYGILAHYRELDWAAQYDVEESLVRISAGVGDTKVLLSGLEVALKAAEAVVTD